MKLNDERIDIILKILLKYVQKDFSVSIPVSDKGDELDALAVGLNTMREELEHYLMELRESKDQIQSILKNAPDAVIVIDAGGKITEWNPMAEKTFGWTQEETAGRFLHELIIPLKYREAHLMGLKHFIQTGQGPVLNKTIEMPALRKDGSEFPTELRISPSSIRGKSFFIGIIKDITERKKLEDKLRESEEKFQKAFQSSAAGITITRLPEGTFLNVNEAFVKMTGFSEEEIIGRNFLELGLITDIKSREEIIQKVQEHGSAKNFEMTIRNRSGNVLEFLSSIETITLKGEKYAINIIYDITDRKRAEEQLETVNKELEAFTYSISHDLRAPLRAISGYANILEEEHDKSLDGEGKRLLGNIRYNAFKMGKLIDDLLAFSRLGKKEIQKSEIDMNELTEGVFIEFNKSAAHHAEIRIGKLLPVYGDYSLIHQVVMNLVSNAIKYSSKNAHPAIEINSSKQDGNIIYSIKDNGVGFDMRYVHKLFGVFQRLHQTEEFEGTGVGLAIVQRIINKHGGKIWAEGEIGKGATFTFSLPDPK
ncbi:MAG: PAS domain S-box protein [Bacteroidetes bacterium]|nr:PAS domain S-box protein [Bacteroidota bacterium]